MNPQADPPAEAVPAATFFAVSVPKLAVMSLFTFGAYEVYWHYRNWRLERRRSDRRFSVLLRALLGPLFAFLLFEHVQGQQRALDLPAIPEPGALALAYLILSATWRLPEPWWLIAVFNFLPLLVVQAGVNRLNARVAPLAPRNDRYSAANVIALLLGALLMLLVIIGLLLAPEESGAAAAAPV